MREMYARSSVTHMNTEYIGGVQFNDTDDYERVRGVLAAITERVASMSYRVPLAALEFGRLVEERLPGRAYFIEVGHENEWVQIFDPRGFVKERCQCQEH